jgi:hypothetical protein
VLKHHSAGLDLGYDVESCREHVALVVTSQLFTCDAKWRTRNTTSDQVYITKGTGLEVPNILLHDIPVRTIQPQCGAELGFILNDTNMVEARPFQAKRLSTAPSTQFK